MTSNFVYQGPTEVDFLYMKEDQQDKKLQAVIDEVLEEDTESVNPNFFPNNGSNSRLDDSNVADGTPILRRGRKVNRPVPAKQKPRPKLNLNYATLRKNVDKPEKDEIIAESPEFKF